MTPAKTRKSRDDMLKETSQAQKENYALVSVTRDTAHWQMENRMLVLRERRKEEKFE